VTEGDQDLGARRLLAQQTDDLRPQDRRGIRRERRNALRVEEDHAGPADAAARSIRRVELHDEEVAFVLEHVLPEGEPGQRLAANVLEQREVLLASLERLFHRDHAVPKHACLAHQFSVATRSAAAVLIRSSVRCRGKSRAR
jgi:hypothetical protein